jgi:hypothetical protein
MRSIGTKALGHLGAIGFSFLIALTAACGGTKSEAKAPTTASADAPRVGSGSPDLSPESTTTTSADPPKSPAVASADNGSDIIPPFTAGKEPAAATGTTTKAAGKGSKKGAGKPKKKAAKTARAT